jgi:glutamate 5-kinase
MPADAVRREVVSGAKRVVVKIGTNAICDERGRLDRRIVTGLARQVARAVKEGRAMTVVASGAVGAGMGELDLKRRPRTLPMLQAVAAVGQGQLMRSFHDAFARHGVRVAQVLVTRDAFEDRTRYLNIRNTLTTLTDCGVLPVINENDAVAVDEFRFGDNDIIAALVANMLAADVLVLLTTVDGVMKGREVLDVITRVDEEALSLADSRRSALGAGGMASKLAAAGMVTRVGEAAVIANARAPRVLTRVLAGQKVGTVLVPSAPKMSGRRRWIAQASRAKGKLVVDDGAARALTQRGRSLLPSGVTAVIGGFGKGETIAVVDAHGRELARGLSNYSAEQIEQIKGLRSSQIAAALGDKPYDEVIHRDNMTLR